MSDNTTLAPASGGDTVRTLDRTGTGAPKTEVVQLDVGGASTSAESLVSAQNPLPVSGTWDQIRVALMVQQAAMLAAQPQNGFVPLELASFLAALANPGLYPATGAEGTAGVIPITTYPVGSLRRYGADPTGLTDSSPALLRASSCNSDVFDDYPGGGTYLFNSETVIPSFPITIRGQARLVPGDSALVNGTLFKLATVAGSGAACLRWSVAAFGVRVSNIGFSFQSATLNQIGIRFILDCRYSTIDNCAFTGGGAGSQGNCIAIQLDGGGVYSGGVMLRDNYFSSGLGRGILLKGSCVTVRIVGNEFSGYAGKNALQTLGAITGGTLYVDGVYPNVPLTGGTGTGAQGQITVVGGAVTAVVVTAGGNNYTVADSLSASNANLGGAGSGFTVPVSVVGYQSGSGIELQYPCVEQMILGNYFEGFTNGIYSNGAASIRQTANDFAVNTNSFVWLKANAAGGVGGYTTVKNQSTVDNYASGGLGVFSSTDADANQLWGFFGDLITGQTVQATRGFQGPLQVSQPASAVGALSVGPGSATTVYLDVNDATTDSASAIRLRASNAHPTWLIAVQFNLANKIEFTPSTVNGGTTYSAPRLSISGLLSTHAVQVADSAQTLFNAGFLETPVNGAATPYTAVLADAGKVLYYNGTGAASFTIPANASVAYPVGTELTFVNDATGATNMTIAITTDTLVLSPGGTTGSRTLAQFGRAKAVKVAATRWVISGSGLT